ncbi:hypothetical protein BDN71DRAFT_1446812 [Pleurotus eryngii]|uniref:F-box domain-containing protein n=1 Tax=Pleurotus eryngii TaxID=5323 RepID=A0A9P6A086_PLEER|nr:hypothetical protein BDN71DRAFT_1446812 [Pleurotus eryngii]
MFSDFESESEFGGSVPEDACNNYDEAPLNCPAQDVIDEEITAHEAVLRELRGRRNIYSPISKLPTEILAKIFVLVRWIDNSPSVGDICHTWREVLVDTSEAWNKINLSEINSLDHAVTMLERTKQAPLYVDCLQAPNLEALHLTMLQISRIRCLDIAMRDLGDSLTSLDSVGPEMKKKSLPNLERLVLRGGTGPGIETAAVFEGVFSMDMLSLHTLELHSISLQSVQFLPAFPLLRKLRIIKPNTSLSSSKVLMVLRCTPALRELEMWSSSLPAPDEGHNQVERASVDLPHLSSLSLRSIDLVDIAGLIQRIQYPPSACVRLRSVHGPYDTDRIKILSAILSHFARSESAALADGMWLLSSSRLPGFQLGASLGNTTLLEIHCENRATGIGASLFDLHKLLPSRQVRALRVGGFVGFRRTERWKDLFKRHEQVETLILELQANSLVVQALTGTARGGKDVGQQQSDGVLPRLMSIKLRGCTFDSRGSQSPLTSSCICEFL